MAKHKFKFTIKNSIATVLTLTIASNLLGTMKLEVQAQSNQLPSIVSGYNIAQLPNKEIEKLVKKIDDSVINKSENSIKSFNEDAEIDTNSYFAQTIIEEDGNKSKTVSFDIKGDNIDSNSKISYVLNEKNDIISESVALGNINSDGSITANILDNGKEYLEIIQNKDGELEKVYEISDDGVKVESKLTKGIFDCFIHCLDGKNVPVWIISAISMTCAIACGITLGAGCVACLAALGFSGSTAISYCVNKCS